MKFIILFVLSLPFLLNTAPNKFDSYSSKYPNIVVENVIIPCGNLASNSAGNTKTSTSIRACKGEIRYCGMGKYRCYQHPDALFSCCFSYPINCPTPT